MPRNLVRYQETGDLHFITFSCHQRQPYLTSPSAKNTFVNSLETMRQRYDFRLIGFVVMPEHVHLLLSEPSKALLSKAIQAIKLSVAVQRSERPFWIPRYYDFNVYSEAKRIEKLRYMHRNPVRRSLVKSPEDWEWSSFNSHRTGERGAAEVESWWTATRKEFPDTNP